MAYTHTFTQHVTTPQGVISDAGAVATADTTVSVSGTVPANGEAADDVDIAFTAAGLESLVLLSTVPCVVTLTGVTEFDGAAGTPTADDVTLVANVIRHVSAITGDCSAISVGANTDGAGAAGTIIIAAIFNS